MAIQTRDAVAARNVAPRDQIGAMAALASNLDNDERGIPLSSTRGALISGLMSEDAVKTLHVYSSLEGRLEKYFKDTNTALRRLALEEGINLGLKRKPGETDPAAELEAVTRALGAVRIPGEKGGAVQVETVVAHKGDAMLMIDEIVRSYTSALAQNQRNLKKIRGNLEEQRAHSKRAEKKMAAAKAKVKELKAHAKKIRRNNTNPVVVDEEASSEESDLDELSDDLDSATDEYSDEAHDESQLSSDLDSYEYDAALSMGPKFQVEWMKAMSKLYPQIEDKEEVLFGSKMVKTRIHKVFGEGLPLARLDTDAIDHVQAMASNRTEGSPNKEGWSNAAAWGTKGDPGGHRRNTHYPALGDAWANLHAVAEWQKKNPGNEFFQQQLRALTASLFFYDYVVAFSATTGQGMGKLESQLAQIILWDDDWGTPSDNFLKALGSFSDLRKWFAGAEFKRVLQEGIGLKL